MISELGHLGLEEICGVLVAETRVEAREICGGLEERLDRVCTVSRNDRTDEAIEQRQ